MASAEHERAEQDRAERPATENELLTNIGEIVTVTLGIGAALAKITARATARGRPLVEPQGDPGPLFEMAYYGTATVANTIGLVLSLATAARVVDDRERAEPQRGPFGQAPTAGGPRSHPEGSAAGTGLPIVHPGATLRVPLSIENPGAEPMNDLVFVCLAMDGPGTGVSGFLNPSAVRFRPQSLSVAAKDFEKLTVYVETSTETPLGHYVATIGLEAGLLESKLPFRVEPPPAS